MKNKKKLQRKINKIVRRVNSSVEQDDLWRGRFVIRQTQIRFHEFADHSGVIAKIVFDFYDKKTKIHSFRILDSHVETRFLLSDLYCELNYFIVSYLRVWTTEGWDKIRNDKTDYSKIAYERGKAPWEN